MTEYRRELNLDTGVARVSYGVEGVRFTREVFASAPDQVIVVHLKADRPGKLNFTARLNACPERADRSDGARSGWSCAASLGPRVCASRGSCRGRS